MGKIIKTVGISFAKPTIKVEVGDTVQLIPEPDNQYDPHAVRIEFNGIKLGYVAKGEEFKEYLFSKGGEFKVSLVKYHNKGDDKLWEDVKVGDMVQLAIDSGMDRVPNTNDPLDEIKRIIYRDEGRLSLCNTKLQLVSSQPYKVEFDPVDHAYYLDGERCISGSKFANRFGVEFDPNTVNSSTGLSILESSAKKLGLTVDETRELWDIRGDAGRARGTMFHAYLEAYGKFIKVIKDNPELESKILPKDNYVREVVKSFFDGRDGESALYEATVWTRINSIACAGEIDRLQIIDVKNKVVRVQDFKGLDLNTKIPTPYGFKTMAELSVDDIVFDKDGNQCKVKNKSDIHHRECYQIMFEDGAKIICDDEHRWLARVGRIDSKSASSNEVYTANELFDIHNLSRPNNIIRIDVAKPLDASDVMLPIDPYVLGIWLADGNRTAGSVTNPDTRIWSEIKARGYEIGEDVGGGKCETRTIKGLFTELKKLGINSNKHIPELYMFASYSQRLDLLRGYFDGDGYWNKTRSQAVMSTTSDRQALDIYTLASSLGVRVYKTVQDGNGFGKNVRVWHISFNPNFNPFLARNQDINIKDTVEKNIRYVKSIKKIDSVPTQCIEVDSPTHTYLASEAMVVTHNTNDDIKKRVSILPPFKGMIKGTALEAYRLQLDFYSAILRKVGYTVEGVDIFHWNQDKEKWDTYSFESIDIKEYITK